MVLIVAGPMSVGCAGTCEVDGETHEVGESFPAEDGCNTCFCDTRGRVACTLVACETTVIDSGTAER